MFVINVSDYSTYPGGRTPDDGPSSGSLFRDDIVIPALKENEKVTINFDNTRGYGTSFLEEVFGGLVRKGFSKDELDRKIFFQSSRPLIVEKVRKFIAAAAAKDPK